MHEPRAITTDIYWLGVNDRETELFEGLWPLPRGVSYNSYLIRGAKSALVDTVKAKTALCLEAKLRALLGPQGKLDYLIINHMEPDHSGAVTLLLELFPELVIVGNAKTARFLADFYGVTDRIRTITDGESLDLGGHHLQFHLTPMVHWPETMMTYDATDGVLFSGDAFGGFGALDGGLFDDEVDLDYYEDEILRYFSNIVGKYSAMVQKAIAKVGGLDIRVIAATHGPVWRRSPATIIGLYDRWSRQEAEPGVTLVYGSMYGNTERMMEAVARGISSTGLSRVRIHNISRSHVSFIIRDAWRYQALVLGSPTYDMELYPPTEHLLHLLEAKKLKNRMLALFGTYGWSGGAVKRLEAFAQAGEWDIVKPVVEARCAPTEADLQACRSLGEGLARRLLAPKPV